MNFRSDIAAELAAIITAGELSQPVTVIQPDDSQTTVSTVSADLTDGEDANDTDGHWLVHRRRLVFAGGIELPDGSRVQMDGLLWTPTGRPVRDQISDTLAVVVEARTRTAERSNR